MPASRYKQSGSGMAALSSLGATFHLVSMSGALPPAPWSTLALLHIPFQPTGRREGEGGQAPEGEAWALSAHPHTACGHAFSHVSAQGHLLFIQGGCVFTSVTAKHRGDSVTPSVGLMPAHEPHLSPSFFLPLLLWARFPCSKWMGWCVDSLQAVPELQALQLPSGVLGQRCQKTESRLRTLLFTLYLKLGPGDEKPLSLSEMGVK